MDGRSLRYLGLMVGLMGLVYLNWHPSGQSPGETVPQSPQVTEPLRTPAKLNDAAEGTSAETLAAGTTPEAWLDALWRADETAVARLLAEGINANAALDARQTRALHLLFFGPACEYGAAAAGVLPVLEQLLQQGASVNAADGRGNTPLMLAAAECDPPVVRRLLAAGADMSATNLLGLTAFELTLSNASPAGRVLTEAGFRLSAEQYQAYREIYHDEREVLAHLQRAQPDSP